MNGYIKKEELIDEFHRLTLGENSLIERLFAAGVYAIIETFPAADVVEVVRCEECKHCMKADKHELWCSGHGSPHRLTTADDFCSKGERQ